jgi:hypothetical protein
MNSRWRITPAANPPLVHGLRNALATERAKVKGQRLLITELRQRNEVISVGGEEAALGVITSGHEASRG